MRESCVVCTTTRTLLLLFVFVCVDMLAVCTDPHTHIYALGAFVALRFHWSLPNNGQSVVLANTSMNC